MTFFYFEKDVYLTYVAICLSSFFSSNAPFNFLTAIRIRVDPLKLGVIKYY